MILRILRKAFGKKVDPINAEKDINEAILKRHSENLWLVLAGKTGTGKTTLLNTIFQPKKKLIEGLGKSGTTEPYTDHLYLDEDKGLLKITDLPGIGESNETKELTNEITTEYLKKCDLVLWLFKSDDNTKISEQNFFNSLEDEIRSKFIIGLSKVDQPVNRGHWNYKLNMPSPKIIGSTDFLMDTNLGHHGKTRLHSGSFQKFYNL